MQFMFSLLFPDAILAKFSPVEQGAVFDVAPKSKSIGTGRFSPGFAPTCARDTTFPGLPRAHPICRGIVSADCGGWRELLQPVRFPSAPCVRDGPRERHPVVQWWPDDRGRYPCGELFPVRTALALCPFLCG